MAYTKLQLQMIFASMIPALINKARELGYQVTGGEWYRSPEEAARLAKLGKGIKNSLHCDKLAIDLNLFKDGVYQTSTEAHRQLGTWWESQSAGKPFVCHWGGNFGDGNHYSLTSDTDNRK